jgi:hypothetical protein
VLLVECSGESLGEAGRWSALEEDFRACSHRNLVLFALIPVAALPHDITGKWTFQVESDAGSGSPTFVVKQPGERLTGMSCGQFIQLAGWVSDGCSS